MILLLVTIGLLNIGMGVGLAMYYGLGPPGLDGICEALGPMPSVPASALSPAAGGPGAPHAPPAAPPAEPLAEENVLGDVRDLATTAQAAMVGSPVESQE
jgi:hypothetical protein